MNSSEYVVRYLAARNVKKVFGIIGSAMYTLFTALGETEGIDYICPLHEQAAGMGADAYARVTNQLGVAVGTIGPGATNMLTACAGSYLDSVPVLYLIGVNGQNSTRGDIPIRSYSFQEIEIMKMFEPITKYCAIVKSPDDIKDILNQAFDAALSGRKGPVAVFLPEDVMYADTNLDLQIEEKDYDVSQAKAEPKQIEECVSLLKKAKRPLLLFGAGVIQSNCEEEARKLIKRLGCPVALSYPARPLIDSDDALNVGSIGIFGTRSGNWAMQNADLILCIGIRLEPYVIGNAKEFGKNADIIVVDVDPSELEKFSTKGPKIHRLIESDAGNFIRQFNAYDIDPIVDSDAIHAWIATINDWKKSYPICSEEYYSETDVNPYVFMDELSKQLERDDIITTDTGLSCVWVGQAFRFKEGQKWLSQFAFSAMGYSLAAAIGAALADDKRVICITGDGGLQMNIQEFASAIYHNLDLKIFTVCNEGYGLIQKTQDDFNKGHYATDRENHVPLPNSGEIARAYGFRVFDIYENDRLAEKIHEVITAKGPVFCSVHVPMTKKITPRVKGGDLMNMIK